jgi:hypothetical protein
MWDIEEIFIDSVKNNTIFLNFFQKNSLQKSKI